MIVYDSNGQPYEADLVLGEQYRELEKENKRLENIFASGIHSCHENCQRPLCVLRRRAEKAEARVGELEFGLKHQCETCEMKSIFDGEHAYALKMQARVKELEATCAELVTDGNALTLAANLAKQSQRAEQAEARVKELQKQEAESRRLFYAEQDKRQSAEFGCEELAGALAKIKDATGDEGETWENVAAWMAAVASSALARREVQP